MSARVMYDCLNRRAPAACKEKHHGNKRKALSLMKVKARRAERKQNNRFVTQE